MLHPAFSASGSSSLQLDYFLTNYPMKSRSTIITTSLTGVSLLAAGIFASGQPSAVAAPPPVDPAHAAHVAAGTMPPDAPALTQQLAEMQAKATQLQALLAKTAAPVAAAPMAGIPAPAPPMAMGMGKMKPAAMPAMKAAAPPMAGMSTAPAPAADGMGMMGMSPMAGGSPAAMSQSALPGFPGASHLYHIGATGFFLDHPQHFALTLEQQAGLNQAKQQAAFSKSTADLATTQVEQELWMLTAADQPDVTQIEAKIRALEKLRGDERLAFIRAVGEASKLLTDEQRKSLSGFAPPAPAAPMAAPGAAMPAGGMPDM